MITSEVRWFRPGEMSSAFREMIAGLPLQEWPERTDHYLLFREQVSCGVKRREGNLEIKALIRREPDETGISHWEKQVLPLSRGEEGQPGLAVVKNRYLTDLDHRGRKTATGENTCQVEISTLHIEGAVYHSFCLEANGLNTEDRRALLLFNYGELQRRFPALFELLAPAGRLSYPEFLNIFTKTK